jgi:hypothetical protein
MDVPTVADILQKTYTAHHRRTLVHFNPLIEEIRQHPPPVRQHRRLKRKRQTDLTTE